MPRKGEDAGALIVRALEEVTEKLNATNELLLRFAERRLDDEAIRAETATGRGAPSELRDAPRAPTGRAAEAQDEGVLRALAAERGLEEPMEGLIEVRNANYPDSRPRYWGIVDFDLHSAKPRLFVFDVDGRRTDSYLCAHGRGSEGSSDDGYSNVFSNTPGSEATSLGVYRCAETYDSDDNGYSLRLDGLESTNSNARSRLIVMHGAWYVSEEFAKKNGRIGRSQGCPALDHTYARKVIDQLKLGSLLIHWSSA